MGRRGLRRLKALSRVSGQYVPRSYDHRDDFPVCVLDLDVIVKLLPGTLRPEFLAFFRGREMTVTAPASWLFAIRCHALAPASAACMCMERIEFLRGGFGVLLSIH